MAWSPVTLVGVLAGLLAVALAAVVLRAARTPDNRRLALLLLTEGVLQASAVLTEEYPDRLVVEIPFLAAIAFAPALALVVLRSLDTPLVTPFRRTWGVAAAFGLSVALTLSIAGLLVGEVFYGFDLAENALATAVWISLFVFLASVYVFSLVASISALRRAKPGTLARSRAKAFAAAFGTRDVGLAAFFIVIITLDALNLDPDWNLDWFPAIATLAYVLLLAYGILRTQLFDLDLRIKIGISRSTVATLGIIAVLAAAKVAEAYLSRTVGYVAGGVAAGVVLVLSPRLNKLGDKVASAALPKVDASAEYLTTRKLEVYRAAVETAWEDGNISVGDRSILDKLREKLDIAGPQAYEVETEVAAAMRKAPPTA